MWKSISGAAAFALGLSGSAMAQEQIRISSDWGAVTATLEENEAADALLGMLPLIPAPADADSLGGFPRG
jgi:hypothetical protein